MNGNFSSSLLRMWAIVTTDCILRFRRTSTLLILGSVCALAYFIIPNPVTEKMTFMQLNDQRVLYTSDSLAIGTVTLHSMILMLLMGFYMVSSSIRRDIQTRTGAVIAATAVRNWEYLTGKCIGNMVFLLALTSGYIFAMMIMHLLRAEEPLQPLIYCKVYFVCSFPAIVFVSVLAVIFEVIPFLSGKFGNIVYFFVWMVFISVPLISMDNEQDIHNTKTTTFSNEVLWSSYFDAGGLAFVIGQVQSRAGTTSFSIGRNTFNPTKPPVRMSSFELKPQWVIPRLTSALFTIPLLLLSIWMFHRFDPIRVRYSLNRSRTNPLHWVNAHLKPITWLLKDFWRVPTRLGIHNHLLSMILTEVLAMLYLYPILFTLIVVNSVISFVLATATLQELWLPIIFCIVTVTLADLPLRERHKGMTTLLYTVPGIKQYFVLWKNGAALLLGGIFAIFPTLRLLGDGSYSTAISLVIGIIFISTSAVGLGMMTGTAKTFMGLALFFYYLALNSHGQPAGFDFAGWFNTATVEVQGFYLVASIIILLGTHLHYQWKLQRNY